MRCRACEPRKVETARRGPSAAAAVSQLATRSFAREPATSQPAARRRREPEFSSSCTRAIRGKNRENQAIFRPEVGPGHALYIGRRNVLEDLKLAIGRLDVVMNHDRVTQLQRFLLIRLALQDVVARELILRALQLMVGNRLGLQALQLGNQPIDSFI